GVKNLFLLPAFCASRSLYMLLVSVEIVSTMTAVYLSRFCPSQAIVSTIWPHVFTVYLGWSGTGRPRAAMILSAPSSHGIANAEQCPSRVNVDTASVVFELPGGP